MGHNQRGRRCALGTDGAKNVGRGVAGVAQSAQPAAAWGPDTGQRALLADPRLILEPDLNGLIPSAIRQGVGYDRGEVFLNVSCASGSEFGC